MAMYTCMGEQAESGRLTRGKIRYFKKKLIKLIGYQTPVVQVAMILSSSSQQLHYRCFH